MDFLSYPERLSIDDLHPSAGMINGVLMAQCLTVGKRERVIAHDISLFALHVYGMLRIDYKSNIIAYDREDTGSCM